MRERAVKVRLRYILGPFVCVTKLFVCVFITAGSTKLFALFAFLCVYYSVPCVFINAVPITKLFARGGGGKWKYGRHVLRETRAEAYVN